MSSIDPIARLLVQKFINKKISVCEIGVRIGETTANILSSLDIANYFAIDPFESYEDYSHDGFNEIINQKGSYFLLQNY